MGIRGFCKRDQRWCRHRGSGRRLSLSACRQAQISALAAWTRSTARRVRRRLSIGGVTRKSDDNQARPPRQRRRILLGRRAATIGAYDGACRAGTPPPYPGGTPHGPFTGRPGYGAFPRKSGPDGGRYAPGGGGGAEIRRRRPIGSVWHLIIGRPPTTLCIFVHYRPHFELQNAVGANIPEAERLVIRKFPRLFTQQRRSLKPRATLTGTSVCEANPAHHRLRHGQPRSARADGC